MPATLLKERQSSVRGQPHKDEGYAAW
jgi:hypothetical protein